MEDAVCEWVHGAGIDVRQTFSAGYTYVLLSEQSRELSSVVLQAFQSVFEILFF